MSDTCAFLWCQDNNPQHEEHHSVTYTPASHCRPPRATTSVGAGILLEADRNSVFVHIQDVTSEVDVDAYMCLEEAEDLVWSLVQAIGRGWAATEVRR